MTDEQAGNAHLSSLQIFFFSGDVKYSVFDKWRSFQKAWLITVVCLSFQEDLSSPAHHFTTRQDARKTLSFTETLRVTVGAFA